MPTSTDNAPAQEAEVLTPFPVEAGRPPAQLDFVAANIVRWHMVARNCAQAAVMAALLCGAEICRAKGLLPHGSFESWCGLRLPGLPKRTRARYMKLAQDIQERVRLVDEGKSVTVALLRTDLESSDRAALGQGILPDPRDLQRAEDSELGRVVHEITDGKTLSELYRAYGILKPKANRSDQAEEELRRAAGGRAPTPVDEAAVYASQTAEKLGYLPLHLDHLEGEPQARLAEALQSAMDALGPEPS